jgi:hypothetical protein
MTEQTMSIEDLCRPPWLDPMYNDDVIGSKVYQPLWGVSSIRDLVVLPPELSVTDYSSIDLAAMYISGLDGPMDQRLFRKDIITPPQQVAIAEKAYVLHSPIEEHSWVTGYYDDLWGRQEKFIPTGIASTRTGEIDPRAPRAARVFSAIKALVQTVPHAEVHYDYLWEVDKSEMHSPLSDTGTPLM